jgi:hypothetical protein
VSKRQFVLRRKGGMLEFRRRLPLDVVGKYYRGKRLGKEFKRSLGTSDWKKIERPYCARLDALGNAIAIGRRGDRQNLADR